jgi:hypothetical protein
VISVAISAVLVAFGGGGCSSDSNPVGWDTFQRDVEADVADVGADQSINEDTAGRDIVGDSDAVVTTDLPFEDVAVDQIQPPDVVDDDTVVDDVVVPTDEGTPDTTDTAVTTDFCTSYDDCADGEVCLLSLGACQIRSTWTADKIALFSIHAMDGAAGDTMVIDGDRFFGGGFGSTVTVKVGTVQINSGSVMKDENRLMIPVMGTMQGPITVYDKDNKIATIKGPFKQAGKDVIACNGSTPAASGVVGSEPWMSGPYAAAYVDLRDSFKTRVFYPAQCGSVRRPAVAGTWPLVIILHGNGALHMNYEYLAELLATWGFVSVMPATAQNMYGDDYSQMLYDMIPFVARFRGINLKDEHKVLEDITTTPEVFWIGHSRGTGRIEEIIHGDETNDYDLWEDTMGAIFLGPVDDGRSVHGSLMVFGGGKDAQSTDFAYEAPYNDHSPYEDRWLIELPGGNHGSFCDAKVYGYGAIGALGDKEPTISRHQQHKVVQTFAIPMIQRAFGQEELFAEYLDTPPTSSIYTVKHD